MRNRKKKNKLGIVWKRGGGEGGGGEYLNDYV